MLKKTKLCTGLMVACGGVLLSAGPSAVAQPAPPAAQSLERVEITGSNIRRTDAETASPVQVISKREIDQAGKGPDGNVVPGFYHEHGPAASPEPLRRTCPY